MAKYRAKESTNQGGLSEIKGEAAGVTLWDKVDGQEDVVKEGISDLLI